MLHIQDEAWSELLFLSNTKTFFDCYQGFQRMSILFKQWEINYKIGLSWLQLGWHILDKCSIVCVNVFLYQKWNGWSLIKCGELKCSGVLWSTAMCSEVCATSHTVDYLSSIFLHSWSHDQPIFYLISHCLNKMDILWNPW